MKNNSSRYPGAVRPIIYSVASALAVFGASGTADAKFAATPLYLQNETTITDQPKIKHNIMFFIDNSGSMGRDAVSGGYPVRISRMDVTKRALNAVLDKHQDKFNWGLQALVNTDNNTSDSDPKKHTKKNYTNGTETFNTSWQQMKTLVDGMSPSGYTPSTRRYYEVVASTVIPNIKYRCQKSYVVMMSDGDANLSCSFSAGNQFHYRFNYDGNNNWDNERNGAYPLTYYNYNVYNAKPGESYRDKAFTDAYKYFGPSPMRGLSTSQLGNVCTRGSDGWYSRFWDTADTPIGGVEGGIAFFSRKLAANDIKTAADGVDAAGVSWDGNPNIDPRGVDYSKQLVQTFTVGFGNSISDSGKKYLTRGASQDGWYFNAAQPDDLLKAFEEIVSLIQTDSASVPFEGRGGTAPATTSSGVPDLAAVVQLNTESWSSKLEFHVLEKGIRKQPVSIQYPSFGNRKTLINTGNATYFINSVPNNTLNNAYFGISDNGKNAGEWQDLLNWTGRIAQDEEIANKSKNTPYSQTYRVRKAGERDLGDILDGGVSAVGNKENGRQKYMVAAANDGMVHLFESTPGSHPYDLKLSYIPAGMEREDDKGENTTTLAKVLKDIADKDYGKSIENHKYGVNGGLTLRQTPAAVSGSKLPQRSFMFGAMGQGGRGAYALNIGGKEERVGLDAAEASWSSSVPLFETAKGEANKLGYTVGTPQIGRVSVKRPADNGRVDIKENIRYAGFLASGYRVEDKNDAKNETALYIYEMLGKEVGTGDKRGEGAGKPGDLLAKISVPVGVGGLSTPTLLDTDFDGVIDVAYAGDRGGNMYRFDLRGETPSQWKAVRIFEGIPSRPITAAPAVSRKGNNQYVVIFGTGSEIYQDDLKDKSQQAVFGVFENLDPKAEAPSKAAVAADLQVQTIDEQDGQLYLSNKSIDKETQKGWVIPLREDERITVKPTMILRTAVVTIRKYASDGGRTIGKEAAEKDLCLPVSNNVSTKTSTSFLGINADNGGALNERSARFTEDKYVRKLDGFGSQYANGLTQEGIVNFTFINPSKVDDSPVSADGDSGGTGTDKELAVSPGTPNNRCFSIAEGNSLLLNTNTPGSLAVKGRICALQRISWRELFF